jgi:hypothetical protein
MDETIGRLLAVGNVAEVFEWGCCVVKLYKFDPMNLLGSFAVRDHRLARRAPRRSCRRSLPFLRVNEILRAAEIATTYRDAYCRAADMPRQAVLSWLPYVAAARLAEDVPGELDDLLKIVDVLARPSPHPITVSPRAMRSQFTLLASTGMKLKRRLRVN